MEKICSSENIISDRKIISFRKDLIIRASLFSRVECDFGASKGKFLTESAILNPTVFFIGIEGIPKRVNRAMKKIDRQGILNAVLWQGWGKESIDQVIPDQLLDTLHLSFPDPWPKRRHWLRRLVNVAFLDVVVRKLKPTGVLKLQTDDLGYFLSMQKQVALHQGWVEVSWEDKFHRPITEFEVIFRNKKVPIYRIAIQRKSND